MTKFRIAIEYDGRGFVGWQRQNNGPSIQEVLEEALIKLSGEKTPIHGSGRTDAGVHALGQVAHFDLEKDLDEKAVRDGLNFHVKPHRVSVLAADIVDETFHARFDATERRYLYRILNRRSPPAILKGKVWWVPVGLDARAMREAARRLVGRHDFTSFRATRCQAQSPVRTLDAIAVDRIGEEIRVGVRAKSFLHHQVRNMVGTLKLVGEGKWTANDVRAALDARDRGAAGPTAPADGLYLEAISYD